MFGGNLLEITVPAIIFAQKYKISNDPIFDTLNIYTNLASFGRLATVPRLRFMPLSYTIYLEIGL